MQIKEVHVQRKIIFHPLELTSNKIYVFDSNLHRFDKKERQKESELPKTAKTHVMWLDVISNEYIYKFNQTHIPNEFGDIKWTYIQI